MYDVLVSSVAPMILSCRRMGIIGAKIETKNLEQLVIRFSM